MSSLNQSGYKDDANEVNSPGAVTSLTSLPTCAGVDGVSIAYCEDREGLNCLMKDSPF